MSMAATALAKTVTRR
uniref:Uncharacterized protein n=1 Tax=Anguilla anguilla TaxID=7936 RepID=A0A0E9XFM3_ANGAN